MIGQRTRVRVAMRCETSPLCDLCRDTEAVNGFTIEDPGSGSFTTNVCAFCMDVETKALARLVADKPRLMVTLGPVS